ncbi:MAG: zinc metalloprotease HtpX [Sulfolobus sp.]
MIKGLVRFRIGMILATISTIVLGFLVVYGLLGYFFGFSETPYLVTGALSFVVIITLIQWLFGPAIIKSIYRLYEVTPSDPTYGWLYSLVQEVAYYNKLDMPKVYIADVPFPNAFAFSSPLYGKNVAITLPLLRILNKEEVKAVLGHELGHLRHKDTELLLAVGLIPTLLYWLGYSLWWSGILGGGGGRNSENNGTLFLIGIALIALSFIFNLFVLFLNRMREAYADINSALTVPDGARNLQTALAKIVLYTDPRIVQRAKKSSHSLGQMLFFAPLQKEDIDYYDVQTLIEQWRHEKVGIFSDLFSDHPHPSKRIKLLDKFIQTQ